MPQRSHRLPACRHAQGCVGRRARDTEPARLLSIASLRLWLRPSGRAVESSFSRWASQGFPHPHSFPVPGNTSRAEPRSKKDAWPCLRAARSWGSPRPPGPWPGAMALAPLTSPRPDPQATAAPRPQQGPLCRRLRLRRDASAPRDRRAPGAPARSVLRSTFPESASFGSGRLCTCSAACRGSTPRARAKSRAAAARRPAPATDTKTCAEGPPGGPGSTETCRNPTENPRFDRSRPPGLRCRWSPEVAVKPPSILGGQATHLGWAAGRSSASERSKNCPPTWHQSDLGLSFSEQAHH